MTRQTQHDREVQTLKDEASVAYDADVQMETMHLRDSTPLPVEDTAPVVTEPSPTPPAVVAGPQFPKMIFRRDGGRQVVQSQAEQDALGASWQETPP